MNFLEILKLSKRILSIEFVNIDIESDKFVAIRNYDANILLDLECESATKVLELTTEKRLFNSSKNFILFGKSFNESLEILGEQDININSKVLLITKEDNVDKIYEIKSPERLRGAPLHAIPIGKYEFGKLTIKPSKISFDLAGNTVFVGINVSIFVLLNN